MVSRLVSSFLKGVGKFVDDLAEGTGNVGSSVSYLIGRTGRQLKEATEGTIARHGRVLNRREQASGAFNRTMLRGEIAQERINLARAMTSSERFKLVAPAGGTKGQMQVPAGMRYRSHGKETLDAEVNRRAKQDPKYNINLRRYEKALASRSQARKFLFGRVAPAAALMGAGQVGGAMMRNVVEERKAFYGEEMYASKYGDTGESAANFIEGAGTFIGATALFGKDPISGAVKSAKKIRNSIKYGSIRNRKITREAERRVDRKLVEVVGSNKRVETFVGPLQVAPHQADRDLLSIQAKNIKTKGIGSFFNPKARKAAQQAADSVAPPVTRRGKPATMNPSRKRKLEADRKEAYDKTYREEVEKGMQKKLRKKAINTEKGRIEDEIKSKKRPDAYTDDVKRFRKSVANVDRQLSKNGRVLGIYGGSTAITAVGAGVVAGALYPETAGGFALGLAGTSILGAKVIRLGMGAKVKDVINPVPKFVTKYPLQTLATSATLATGAALGMSNTPAAAAEGNIEEVTYGRESTIRKLNYSTAGLVQSIHNNRRM